MATLLALEEKLEFELSHGDHISTTCTHSEWYVLFSLTEIKPIVNWPSTSLMPLYYAEKKI